jgi:predicted nucleic acid-binding protein
VVNLYFFDSSALVKRYVHEQGTQWVQTVTALTSSPIVFVSRITWVEVQSALARLAREQKIDAAKLATTRRLFEYDWANQYQVIELEQDIATHAGQLVQQYVLRAYDSVQLASALSVFPFFARIDPQLFTFVCADDRLLMVAKTEGMQTENPNNHP